MSKPNPLECHGTLKRESCGCLVNTEIGGGFPVERSANCRNPEHKPPIKVSYQKKRNDMKAQVSIELNGSAVQK